MAGAVVRFKEDGSMNRDAEVSVLLTGHEVNVLMALFMAVLSVHGAPPDDEVRAGMKSIGEKLLAADETLEAVSKQD